MKVFIILLVSCFIGSSYAQSQDGVDQRLLDYHGDKVVKLYENDKEYYDFLLYELNSGFYIVEDAAVNQNEKIDYKSITTVKNKNGDTFESNKLDDPSTFNFFNYNFVRSQENRIYYDLGDGRLLVFYSLNELKSNYVK